MTTDTKKFIASLRKKIKNLEACLTAAEEIMKHNGTYAETKEIREDLRSIWERQMEQMDAELKFARTTLEKELKLKI